jgi:hypothetical protein
MASRTPISAWVCCSTCRRMFLQTVASLWFSRHRCNHFGARAQSCSSRSSRVASSLVPISERPSPDRCSVPSNPLATIHLLGATKIYCTLSKRCMISIIESDEWKSYLEQHPELRGKVGLTLFKQGICNCIRKPTSRSCVDVIKSIQEYFQRSIARAIISHPNELKNKLKECNCEVHRAMRDGRVVACCWTDSLFKAPLDYLTPAMCRKKE